MMSCPDISPEVVHQSELVRFQPVSITTRPIDVWTREQVVENTRQILQLPEQDCTQRDRLYLRTLGLIANSEKCIDQTEKNRTDRLTGVLSQGDFIENYSAKAAAAEDKREPFASLFIDLDNFKQVNDKKGHNTGDSLLAQIGSVLLAHTGDADLVWRRGGDEFVIVPDLTLVPQETDSVIQHIKILAEKIQYMISEAVRENPSIPDEFHVGGSIGYGIRKPDESLDDFTERIANLMKDKKKLRKKEQKQK